MTGYSTTLGGPPGGGTGTFRGR